MCSFTGYTHNHQKTGAKFSKVPRSWACIFHPRSSNQRLLFQLDLLYLYNASQSTIHKSQQVREAPCWGSRTVSITNSLYVRQTCITCIHLFENQRPWRDWERDLRKGLFHLGNAIVYAKSWPYLLGSSVWTRFVLPRPVNFCSMLERPPRVSTLISLSLRITISSQETWFNSLLPLLYKTIASGHNLSSQFLKAWK